jgi:hypothetical protein
VAVATSSTLAASFFKFMDEILKAGTEQKEMNCDIGKLGY